MSDCDLQSALQRIVDEHVGSGRETGLQACVVHDGAVVVDAVAGVADPATARPVTSDTLFWSASALKGVAAALAHVLVERGVLDYDQPIVDWWPEFGAHGKSAVTLRHVLLHQAGVPGLPDDITVEQLCDWDTMCAIVAESRLWWEPGTRMGYHAMTFGFLIGEVVRRATGRPVAQALCEELTGPLGIADEVLFGVPPRLLGSIARQVTLPGDDPPPSLDPSAPASRAVPPAIRPDADVANRADVLTADVPSMGTASARGLARLYAALLENRQLVSDTRLRDMAALHFQGRDVVMEFDTRLAFGFNPDRPAVASRSGSAFGMVGANGSVAYADIDSGVAVAVTRNRFRPGDLAVAAEIDAAVAEAFPIKEVLQ